MSENPSRLMYDKLVEEHDSAIRQLDTEWNRAQLAEAERDEARQQLRGAVELAEAAKAIMPTLNHYSGPGARTAVSHEHIERYRRLERALAAFGGQYDAAAAGRRAVERHGEALSRLADLEEQ